MTDSLNDRKARGYELLREMFGDKWQAAYEAGIAAGGFGAAMGTLALEFAFAETWARPGLDRRSRSLVTIGALIAQGKPDELKNHIRAGLNNGITVAEMEHVILQTVPYCGFPAASQALEAAAFILKERGISVETAKDRGNL